MARHITKPNSTKFNGSIGEGARKVPTAAPTAPQGRSATATAARPQLPGACTRYTDILGEDGLRTRCTNLAANGDWCRECDGFKKPKPGRDKPVAQPSEGAIKAALVRQCSGIVTDSRSHQERQCKNAIVSPAERCHDHGGDISTSLFKTYAKATAEADRGELTLPTEAELAASPEAGRALMERDLLNLVETDPSAFLRMAQAAASFNQEHTVGRFSAGNQLMVLSYAYHYELQRNRGDKDAALDAAIARTNQLMHTKAGWAKLGREVGPNADPVPVLFYTPGERTVVVDNQDEDENDSDKTPETRQVFAPRWGVRVQYFADQTSGDDLPEAADPLDIPLPAGHGDPVAYRGFLEAQARAIGVNVVTDPNPKGTAKAYFSPSEKTIHLWADHAGGDPATQAHTLAHELGHALDAKLDQKAYGTRGCDERGRAEVFAETFAYLVSGRYGVNSTQTSAGYATGWAKALGGLGSREAMSVMRDALTAAHGILYPQAAQK